MQAGRNGHGEWEIPGNETVQEANGLGNITTHTSDSRWGGSDSLQVTHVRH